jgi:TrmH family RNA methyltransferase
MLTKAQVKYIQSLGHKKLRESEQAFVAEGPKLINELLRAPNVKPLAIYAVDEFADEHPEIENVVRIRDAELERISSLSAPNSVLGIFSIPWFETAYYSGTISLMLDGIQDPGNLGSIIRSADWFGIRNIICSPDCADNFNAKVVQSTMGSITRVRLDYADLHQFITQKKLPPLYATTLNGSSIFEMGPVKEGIIIIGNESKGIHDELLHKAHHRITIPKKGQAESLNAGVATGIILAQFCANSRQWVIKSLT